MSCGRGSVGHSSTTPKSTVAGETGGSVAASGPLVSTPADVVATPASAVTAGALVATPATVVTAPASVVTAAAAAVVSARRWCCRRLHPRRRAGQQPAAERCDADRAGDGSHPPPSARYAPRNRLRGQGDRWRLFEVAGMKPGVSCGRWPYQLLEMLNEPTTWHLVMSNVLILLLGEPKEAFPMEQERPDWAPLLLSLVDFPTDPLRLLRIRGHDHDEGSTGVHLVLDRRRPATPVVNRGVDPNIETVGPKMIDEAIYVSLVSATVGDEDMASHPQSVSHPATISVRVPPFATATRGSVQCPMTCCRSARAASQRRRLGHPGLPQPLG